MTAFAGSNHYIMDYLLEEEFSLPLRAYIDTLLAAFQQGSEETNGQNVELGRAARPLPRSTR